MPETSSIALSFVVSFELVLLLLGCFLLWRHGLSRAGQTHAAERTAAMPAWDISITQFLLFLWLIICGGLLAQTLTSLILKSTDLHETMDLIISSGAFQGGMLLGVFGFKTFLERKNGNPSNPPAWSKITQYGIVTLLIALPILTVVGLSWQYLMQLLGVPLEEQDLIAIFANIESPILLGLMIILAIVMAPVTEELIFRGGIFRYFRTRVPRWVALLGPALLFAALHANLASFAPLTVLGIIFALAYERTGSIAVPIIAHGLFNLNTIILIFAGVGL